MEAEHADAGGERGARPALSTGRRFGGLLLAWALLFAALPGVVTPDGPWGLAVLGIGVFGAVALRPAPAGRARRAFLAAWLANAIGTGATMAWIWYVVPFGLLYIGFGMGFYVTLGAVAARRIARRFAPGVALAVAWAGFEVARTVLPPPFGLGWFLVGFHAHATPWLVGGARVFGVEGLGFVLAALGGVVAELLLDRRVRRSTALLSAGSLAACVLAGTLVPAPETIPGPRVLLVQPSVPQEVKQSTDFVAAERRAASQTLDALADQPRDEPVDLVCWGESMLAEWLVEPGVEAALAAGAEVPEWWGDGFEGRVAYWRASEERFFRRGLLRRFPDGVSFLTGAVVLDSAGDRLVRRNGVVLFDPAGERGESASKRFLVPGAETALGFERFAWARKLAWRAMGYVPDFSRGERTGVLHLATRDGRGFEVAALVCFDNAFPEAFREPLAAGRVDFHVVASNEAWYHDSFEMDQMLAFSRVVAASTGRSVVRATNSGVSCVIGPDGREIARLRVQGADRSVRGSLAALVPVPVDPLAHPPYVDLRDALRGGLLLLVALLLGLSRSVGRSLR